MCKSCSIRVDFRRRIFLPVVGVVFCVCAMSFVVQKGTAHHFQPLSLATQTTLTNQDNPPQLILVLKRIYSCYTYECTEHVVFSTSCKFFWKFCYDTVDIKQTSDCLFWSRWLLIAGPTSFVVAPCDLGFDGCCSYHAFVLPCPKSSLLAFSSPCP